MMATMRSKAAAGAVAIALAVGAGSATIATTAHAGGAPAGHLTFSSSLTSQGKNLTTVGSRGQFVFGSNLLTGTTSVGGQSGTIQWVATVNYTDGSGPWTGLITVTTPTGTFGLDTRGQASFEASTGTTTFKGTASVIGGTGAYVNMRGVGTETGVRTTALGGAVDFTWHLTVVGAGA